MLFMAFAYVEKVFEEFGGEVFVSVIMLCELKGTSYLKHPGIHLNMSSPTPKIIAAVPMA